jgi:hypothetical protein
MWKETTVAQLGILYQNYRGGTLKHNKKTLNKKVFKSKDLKLGFWKYKADTLPI